MEAGAGGLDLAQPKLDCCSSDFTQFEPPLFHLNTAMHGLFVPQCNASRVQSCAANALDLEHQRLKPEKAKCSKPASTGTYCKLTL